MDSLNNTRAWQTKALWVAIALLGAVSLGIVALNRGEAVNAAWLVVAAVCVYFIAYRFYGLFVANRAALTQPNRSAISLRQDDSCSLDHLVGNREHARRDGESERLGSFQVDYQLVLGRRLYRKVSRLLALEDAVDVTGSAAALIEEIGPIGNETTGGRVKAGVVDGG
jgi:Carbon starvation protein CstA